MQLDLSAPEVVTFKYNSILASTELGLNRCFRFYHVFFSWAP